MHRANKPLIINLNQHITCKLCKGYFIDATTINECLHTFCRSCIVQYLEKNKYCPVCDVQVHKTKPLLNIRPDKTIQDIVYKLVPRLYKNEIQRRKEFYDNHPETKPTSNDFYADGSYQHLLTPEETIYTTLTYYECKEMTRYLRCPAAVSVAHLKKLIQAKYDLNDNHRVDILYNQDCLNPTLTLMDIAYIYKWKKKLPLELYYKIYKCTSKNSQLSDEETQANNNNWKEVQLRISENGEMSITGIQDTNTVVNIVNSDKYKSDLLAVVENKSNNKREMPGLKFIGKNAASSAKAAPEKATTDAATRNSDTVTISTTCVSVTTPATAALTKTVFSTVNSTKCSTTSESTNKTKSASVIANDKGVKRKSESVEESAKPSKQLILSNPATLVNLSNNHPLKKHAKLNRNGQIVEKVEEVSILPKVPVTTASKPVVPTKTAYSPVLNVPKPTTSNSFKIEANATVAAAIVKPEPKVEENNSNSLVKSGKVKTSPSGYKTLREPPKSWNSQIAKANLSKSISSGSAVDAKGAEMKSVRPKFFKGRNMPRYLGNPASGVKPMYQVQTSPEKAASEKSEIKKHSIVKIDPKTLKPISEKAPETTSLSTQSDLKINTSSVSIFNPLKLQSCSPKNERRSPKSPHSPKLTQLPTSTTTTLKISHSSGSSTNSCSSSGSPTSKRDKINLNFTPPNPFIPNLASPTLNPNQFLYPPGSAAFPSYDPRVMVAYHSLWYSHRMGFPTPPLPSMSLDLNHQRKGFELMAPSTSPKFISQTSHSAQVSAKTLTTTAARATPTTVTTTSSVKSTSGTKKHKESSKSEKSLENTVEKLTQNRVKEQVIRNESKTKEASVESSSTSNASENKVVEPPKSEVATSKAIEKVEVEKVVEKCEEKPEKAKEESKVETVKVEEEKKVKEPEVIKESKADVKKDSEAIDTNDSSNKKTANVNVEETVGTNSITNNKNSVDLEKVAGAVIV